MVCAWGAIYTTWRPFLGLKEPIILCHDEEEESSLHALLKGNLPLDWDQDWKIGAHFTIREVVSNRLSMLVGPGELLTLDQTQTWGNLSRTINLGTCSQLKWLTDWACFLEMALPIDRKGIICGHLVRVYHMIVMDEPQRPKVYLG